MKQYFPFLFKKCDGCKRHLLWFRVKRRRVYVPVLRKTAYSQLHICGNCQKNVQNAIMTP